MDRIGIVVIGRNEGELLERCFESLRGCESPIVYVDSRSTDGSVDVARRLGVEVVELDDRAPVNAARGRNTGAHFLLEQTPTLEFIQFVDGDCEITPSWIPTAVQYLDSHPDVAVVWGRLRERARERNAYHRLADMEWNVPAGDCEHCGGIAFFRARDIIATGGFDESLAVGEEPELCLRIRRRGGRIVRLDAEMALHDIDMVSFSQWWRRSARGGRAYLEGVWQHGWSTERFRTRELVSIVGWGLLLPVAALALSGWSGGASLALLGAYPVLWLKIRRRRLRRGDQRSDASLYAGACIVGKFAQVVGVLEGLGHHVLSRHGAGQRS